MPSKPTTVYWDSCVFIDRIQGTPARIELLTELTNLADKGGLRVVTSALTIAEVLKGPDPSISGGEQEELILSYFEHEWIELRPVDRRVAEEAARIRRAHCLKTADAVHVATAILAHVTSLHTYDYADLLKRNGKCGSPPLLITEPTHPESTPLFDQLGGSQTT